MTSGGNFHPNCDSTGASLKEATLGRTHPYRTAGAIPARGRRHEIVQPSACCGRNDQARLSPESHYYDWDHFAYQCCSVRNSTYLRSWSDLADWLSWRCSRFQRARRQPPLRLYPRTGLCGLVYLGWALLSRRAAARSHSSAKLEGGLNWSQHRRGRMKVFGNTV